MHWRSYEMLHRHRAIHQRIAKRNPHQTSPSLIRIVLESPKPFYCVIKKEAMAERSIAKRYANVQEMVEAVFAAEHVQMAECFAFLSE